MLLLHSVIERQDKITDIFPVKKKRDRFNGLSEVEVMAKLLPDHLDYDLDIIIVSAVSFMSVLQIAGSRIVLQNLVFDALLVCKHHNTISRSLKLRFDNEG